MGRCRKVRGVLWSVCWVSMLLGLTACGTGQGTGMARGEYEDAPIYWVMDETRFAQVFALPDPEDAPAVHALSGESSAGQEAMQAVYTFDVDGEGPIAPIVVRGQMEKCQEGALSCYAGQLWGMTLTGETGCLVYAVVEQEIGGEDRLHAGITVVPEGASDWEENIFFALGEPFLSQEPEQEPEPEPEEEEDSYQKETWTVTGFEGNLLGLEGASQLLEFFYNPNVNRVRLEVTSNAGAVEAFFARSGSASVLVGQLTVGLEDLSPEDLPYLVNVHAASGVEEDVPGITSIQGGRVLFDGTRGGPAGVPVCFDETPFFAEFNLKSPEFASGKFSAYSEIVYVVTYRPNMAVGPIRFSVPGGRAQTVECCLEVH